MATHVALGVLTTQVNSKTADQPAWVFGSSKRFQYDHVKRAATAPGPGAYALTDGVGPQVTSNRVSTPRFGFGSSNRDHMASNASESLLSFAPPYCSVVTRVDALSLRRLEGHTSFAPPA